MTKTLVIVESPAKAKKISKYLGDNYIVKATVGHVVDLTTSGKYHMGIDLDNDFKIDYAILPDKVDKVEAILTTAKNVDEILIASDPDREGEAIACHIADLIKSSKKPIQRIEFHEITKKAIQAAIKKPRELDRDLYAAQQARRVLDRIVGFSVSPYVIKRFGPSLSAGRVQSVAVRLIVDREREIESFEPEEYWNITSTLAKDTKSDKFAAKYDKKIDNETDALKIKKELEKDTYLVDSVISKESIKKPAPPFVTATLATSAAGKFRFAAARTMKAAQSLYENGYITYIRTDSVRIAEDAIEECRNWLTENKHDIPIKPNFYITKDAAQDAHEAIRPTNVELLQNDLQLSEDEKKIYGLIWEKFVASQMNPAIYDTCTVMVKSSSDHLLKANGRALKYSGYLDILKENTSKKDIQLPSLKKGDKLILVPPKVKAEQKFTQPPSRYSEGTLVEELKDRGIGRPSTYAAIMAKISNKNYVETKSNIFYPTELGKKVVDCLTQFFKFMDYEYTALMESELDKIAEGNLEYVAMLANFYTFFKTQLRSAYVAKDCEAFNVKCDLCKSPMILKKGPFGDFFGCSTYPACKKTIKSEMIDGKPVPITMYGTMVLGVSCPKCNFGMMLREGKNGPFYSCVNYPKCTGTSNAPCGKKCPDCGKDLYNVFNVLTCMNSKGCGYEESCPNKGK